MKRRAVLAFTTGTVICTALPGIAQTQRVPRLGFLGNMPLTHPVSAADWKVNFAQMKRLGWEEGRNLTIVRTFAMEDPSQYPAHAEELVAAGVDVIFAPFNDRLEAAYKATRTIPIVTMAQGIVELGYAKSLARPGGNVTGIEYQGLDYAGKHIELMHAIQPGLRKIGFSGNFATPSTVAFVQALQAAGNKLGVTIIPLPNTLLMADIDPMLGAAKRADVQVLYIGGIKRFLLGPGLRQIQAWASANKVVTFSSNWQRGELLLAHGLDGTEMIRVAWDQVDRVLRGGKPADIPIVQPTKFELIVNQGIANAMGLTIPQDILLRADEVIL